MRQMYALGERRTIDLTLGENPLGCSPAVGRALAHLDQNLSRYPQAHGTGLKSALADHFHVETSQIVVANGSEALITIIPHAVAEPGDEVVIPQLTFPLFATASQTARLNVLPVPMNTSLGIDLAAVRAAITDHTSVIFICNPNNPTGAVLPKKRLLTFLAHIPANVTVVVDEAGIDFGGESILPAINHFSNLIVLRTFSKAFGLANIRVSMAAAHPKVIGQLESHIPIFSVSGFGETAVLAALADEDFIQQTMVFVIRQRQLLATQLTSLGFSVSPSQTNNLFVKIPDHITEVTFQSHLLASSVSVVPGSSFDGFDDRFFRISVRDAATNQHFLRVLRTLIGQ